MSDLGLITYYLGIDVIQGNEGIILKQARYARKILSETGMGECNDVHTPMEFCLKLSRAEEEQSIDVKQYRKSIGCLRYLLHTRPDLAFNVGLLSRYMHDPKQVLRYLKGSVSLGIVFRREDKTKLSGFSDSSHNIDEDDWRSTTCHVFYLNECPISWCSQK